MADQRTIAELLRAPTEGYAEAIMVPSILAKKFELKHSLINMMTSDQFFGLEKDNLHDHIRWFNRITSTIKYKDVSNSAIKLMLFLFCLAGVARRWLEKEPPRHILTWEDLVSLFINEMFPPQEQQISVKKSPIFNNGLMNRFMRHGIDIKISFCLTTGGNTFPELRDNIQGYVAAATVNYNQGNSVYCPPEQSYQAPTQQNQVVPLSELEKVKRMNEANMKAMQTQINNVKNELRNEMKNLTQASMSNQTNELKNMMASFFQMNTASTSGSGSLPSNTIANPKGELKSITTRSGIVLDGPSVPIPPLFINSEEDERVEETLTDKDLAEYTIKVPPSLVQKSKTLSQRNFVVHQRDPVYTNIPYPSRMLNQK
nr:reverse transcriptase domain-containing protein [Tanacetum cinerariifolium]